MYYLKKTLEVSASHLLTLKRESKCKNLHGHNWVITIHCKREELGEDGMILDFTIIKEIVMKLDHGYLNDLLDFNPTAENIAKYLCTQIPFCYKVDVQESLNNEVSYELPA